MLHDLPLSAIILNRAKNLHVSKHHIERHIGRQRGQLSLLLVWQPAIIGIEKREKIPASRTDPFIYRFTNSSVRLSNDLNHGITAGYRCTLVGRAIIHHD